VNDVQGSQEEAIKIEIGMVTEADEGNLGLEDIGEAKVTDIVHDQTGNVESIIVEKGIIFRKYIEIPLERIQSVTHETEADGSESAPWKVLFSASEDEVDVLTAVGLEEFPPKDLSAPEYEVDLLDLTEKALPTVVGLRRLEVESKVTGKLHETPGSEEYSNSEGSKDPVVIDDEKCGLFKVLGPGLLSGMAGNDASDIPDYNQLNLFSY